MTGVPQMTSGGFSTLYHPAIGVAHGQNTGPMATGPLPAAGIL